MDRLLIIEPQELILKFEVGEKSSATVRLKNVMYTMPVAFKVQPSAPKRYTIKPTHGIIAPLGVAAVDIMLNPQTELPDSFPHSHDKFLVKSVVVPGGSQNEAVSLDWFTAKKKQVFSDHGLRVKFIGGGILRKLLADGSMENVREVLELDEELVDSKDDQGRTAMHIAVASGRPELVQLLLEFMADVEAKTNSGETALREAAAKGEALMVELLLARRARTESRNPSGWSALHHAVLGGHDEVLRLLLEKGAEVNAKVNGGRTAVHMAVEGRRHMGLELLLQAGAGADVRDGDGEAPLHRAVANRDGEAVELLLRHGANKWVRNARGQTPGDLARSLGERTLLEELSLGDELRRAASRGRLDELQKSLQAGASPNGTDEHGWTALHRAAFKGHISLVRVLIEAGADLKSTDNEGYTVLHCATEAGQKDVVQLLLKHGAPMNALSYSGCFALDLANAFNYSSIISLLLEWGATSSQQQPPLPDKSCFLDLKSSKLASSPSTPRMKAFVIR